MCIYIVVLTLCPVNFNLEDTTQVVDCTIMSPNATSAEVHGLVFSANGASLRNPVRTHWF